MSDAAEPKDRTQLYLITPPGIDLETFPDRLAAVLDAVEISCLRLRLGSQDADAVARAADAVRLIAHERDVPFVVEKHLALAERLGLDGVHLEGTRNVRKARETLGEEAIVGTFCGTSRHDGMTAGEAGADYVSFGPVADDGLGGEVAELELFSWWSDMIELPVVAEGALIGRGDDPLAKLRELAPIADFLGLGEDLWAAGDPVALIRQIDAILG
ncbi:thiamine phosphate synthase [Mangrovicoccus algicola]|uniref:Thiamine phosphate synthase n=1 Tax=Mangrovicoccus algicola TaxID=2771008 RepID=A0A8J7CYW1_9RHOB|nr:thiamine phosphate synthase [Mangrovicoccus algicola]MBE3637033.1 thiamine phosphate synthase [Mangrovicoccus algicola]